MIKVAVGIILFENKILVCQRKKTVTYPLKWEFPGGKVEVGETEINCLHREIFEELSIKIKIDKLFYQQTWEYDKAGKFSVDYFLIKEYSGKINNNVFNKIEWAQLENLKNYDMLDGNWDVINKLITENFNL